MLSKFKAAWRLLRRLSGDDAYECYLENYARQHSADCEHGCVAPMSKQAFFKQWQDEKWHGVKRCC
ncbi:MAG: YbdD/YjiX family protein [Methylobacter sp.]|nr:YbdD/YjiX family protein [Methylococcales bacterium]MDD5112702.1 YbdD/YjiX family protein [Methylobacter sp.]